MSRITGWFMTALLVAGFACSSWAADDALDTANNYVAGALTNGANGGFGFDPWDITTGTGAVAELADSTEATADINSANGLSFKFLGGNDGVDGTYTDAIRPFNGPMNAGDTLSFVMAYNWNGGFRGFALQRAGGELVYVQFGGGDELTYGFDGGGAVLLDTNFFGDATLEVTITQLAGNAIEVDLLRVNDMWTTNLVSGTLGGPATRIKFYNGGHAGDNVGYALYVNDLELVASTTPVLSLMGRDAMPVNYTNSITVTRNGDLTDPLTVALSSDDPAVVSVPVDVVIAATEASAEFDLVSVAGGVATVTATAAGFPDATLQVTVYDIAYDDSSYYGGTWADASNGGAGFGAWTLQNNDDAGLLRYAGAFLGDSSSGGANVNASSGDAFGMYANGAEGPLSEALRGFDDLGIGESISVMMGVNFRNGSKGFDLWHDDGVDLTRLVEVAVYADEYWYQNHAEGGSAVALGWAYASDSVIEVTVSRHDATTYSVLMERTGSAPAETLVNNFTFDNPPNTMRFYIAGTESGDQNNLYFNRLAIFTGVIGEIEPETPALSIQGIDAMAYFTNTFTVSRTGPTDDALTVNLVSSAPGVVSVPATAEIALGDPSVTFLVTGVSAGTATITASAVAFVDVIYTVDVVADIAYDDTQYYDGSWDNGDNGGGGFGDWALADNGDGVDSFTGFFLGNGPVNAGDNRSFGMYANGLNDPLAQAIRSFDAPLGVGESFAFQMAVNFRNGSKGADVWANGPTDRLFEIAVYNDGVEDGYWYNNHSVGSGQMNLGWEYAADTVIDVTISRVGTSTYNVEMVRNTVDFGEETVLLEGVTFNDVPDTTRFYVFSTDGGGDENNLFFNGLKIYTGIVGTVDDSPVINNFGFVGTEANVTIDVGENGVTYRLYRTDDLTTALVWTLVASAVGNGVDPVSLTDDDPSDAIRFYGVTVETP